MYETRPVKSKTIEIPGVQGWDDVTSNFNGEDAKAVVWYYDKIEFYQLSNGVFDYGERTIDEVVRLRLFNERKEVHIWRSNGILKGRLRDDSAGDEIEYVRAEQIMNGTTFTTNGKILNVTEEKGTNYELPFADLLNKDNLIERLKLITRNYIGYNDQTWQAGYIDSRFEEIEVLKK